MNGANGNRQHAMQYYRFYCVVKTGRSENPRLWHRQTRFVLILQHTHICDARCLRGSHLHSLIAILLLQQAVDNDDALPSDYASQTDSVK